MPPAAAPGNLITIDAPPRGRRGGRRRREGNSPVDYREIMARNRIFQVARCFLLSGRAFKCKVLFKWRGAPARPWDRRLHFLIFKCAQTSSRRPRRVAPRPRPSVFIPSEGGAGNPGPPAAPCKLTGSRGRARNRERSGRGRNKLSRGDSRRVLNMHAHYVRPSRGGGRG